MITLDALHTTRDTERAIVVGADYLFTVKGNCPDFGHLRLEHPAFARHYTAELGPLTRCRIDALTR